MRRALTALLAGTVLLTACGGETETTTESTDQGGAGATDEAASEAFAACLEEQGLQGMGGGGFGPPSGDSPGERPTDPPPDMPSDPPADGPGELPQQSAEDMEARQACGDEAGIDMAPGDRGTGGRPGPADSPS